MTSALKKFKLLEKSNSTESQQPSVQSRPKKRKDLELYSDIATKFESPEVQEAKRKRAAEERRELMRKERERREREAEELRKRKEEEERQKKIMEEEEAERQRIEEEKKRIAEEAEKRRLERKKLRDEEEAKYRKLKPAQAMFERARQAKLGVAEKKPVTERILLPRGTISELRGKLFERDKSNASTPAKKQKVPPKKLVIGNKLQNGKVKNCEQVKSENIEGTESSKCDVDNNDASPKTVLASDEAEETKKCDEKQPEVQVAEESKTNSKRQSFITDFAALEKTYRILGMSNMITTPSLQEITSIQTNAKPKKSKKKTKGKSQEEQKAPETTAKQKEELAKLNSLDKGQSKNKAKYFQEIINETKGKGKKLNEISGTNVKKINLVHENEVFQFQQNKKNSSDGGEKVLVDRKKFKTFLDKFEPQDQREAGKAKVAKMVLRQKQFQKQKSCTENTKEYKSQNENDEKHPEIVDISENKDANFITPETILDENPQPENEASPMEVEVHKPKKSKKKKKKKVVEKDQEQLQEPSKLPSIGSATYKEMKSIFERKTQKKKERVEEPEPSNKLAHVNKLNEDVYKELFESSEKDKKIDIEKKVNLLNPKASTLEKIIKFESKKPVDAEPRKANTLQPAKKITVIQTEPKDTEVSFLRKPTSSKKTTSRNSFAAGTREFLRSSRNVLRSSKEMLRSSKEMLRSSKEMLRSSKEKLFRLSMEKLNETFHGKEETDKKPTQNEMQNYLLTHVLFDEKTSEKQYQISDSDHDKELKEFKESMEQYLSLIDEDKPKKKKTKKEDKLPKLNTVEVKNIQKQFESKVQLQKSSSNKQNLTSKNKPMQKESEILESGKNESIANYRANENNKSPKLNEKAQAETKNDCKVFDRSQAITQGTPAEQDKELKQQKSFNEEEKSEFMKRLKKAEKEEERLRAVYEEMLKSQIESKERRLKEAEALKEMREKIEPALKTKKVLNRIQHIFSDEDNTDNTDSSNKKSFEDQTLVGFSDVMGKVKSKFEGQDDEKVVLYSKGEVKRKLNQNALIFEVVNKSEDSPNSTELKRNNSVKEWSWKKKDQGQLNAEAALSMYARDIKETKTKVKDSVDKNDDLTTELNRINTQIAVKDPEKEHERKMEEIEAFMAEMQEYLSPQGNTDLSITDKENVNKTKKQTRPKRKKEKDTTPREQVNLQSKRNQLEDIKFQLMTSMSDKKQENYSNDDIDVSVAKLRNNLLNQLEKSESDEIENKLTEKLVSKQNVNDKKSLFEQSKSSVKQPIEIKRVRVRLISFPGMNSCQYVTKNLTQEWAYKKKEILSFLNFINDNAVKFPSSVLLSSKVALSCIEISQDEYENAISGGHLDEYSSFMKELCDYLQDKNNDDHQFKLDIEKYLEIIEEPRAASSKLVLNTKKKLEDAFNEIESPESPHIKSLEELKAQQQNQNWKWKEKDIKDMQNFIMVNDDIAPSSIVKMQQELQDLDEEIGVIESIVKDHPNTITRQIKEEKEKEFETFMNEIRDYLGSDANTNDEKEFQKGMKSFVSIIDDKHEERTKETALPKITAGPVGLSKIKKMLRETSTPQCRKKMDLQVGKLSPVFNQSSEKKCISKIKDKPATIVTKEKTHEVKKLFEKKMADDDEVKTYSAPKRKQIFVPGWNDEEDKKLEVNRKMPKDSPDKNGTPKLPKFSPSLNTSNNKKVLIEQQKETYQQESKAKNVSLSSSPKTEEKNNRNSEKIKSKQEVVPSLSEVKDPEERRRLILAKYGVKDRPIKQVSSSSESSDEDDDAPVEIPQELYLRYGLDRFNSPESSPEPVERSTSLTSFHDILVNIRQATMKRKLSESRNTFDELRNEYNSTQYNSSTEIDRIEDFSDRKGVFESYNTSRSTSTTALGSDEPIITNFQERQAALNSALNCTPHTHRKHLENDDETKLFRDISDRQNIFTPSPKIESPKPVPKRSSSLSIINKMFQTKQQLQDEKMSTQTRDSTRNSHQDLKTPNSTPLLERRSQVEKSSSFSKFKEAFEEGSNFNTPSEELEHIDVQKQSVNAELEVLKSSTKVKNLFRINKPKNAGNSLVRSATSTSVFTDLDDKTMKGVSKANTMIKNMFEAQTPKVTYGAKLQSSAMSPQPTRKAVQASAGSENKTWVLDTINKYFDVIVEEEKEESTDSEYSSAEEELPEPITTTKPAAATGLQQSSLKAQPSVRQTSAAGRETRTGDESRAAVSGPVSQVSVADRHDHPDIANLVDDAAKEFDNLLDESSNDENSESDLDEEEAAEPSRLAKGAGGLQRPLARSCTSLARSNSSSKIRGLFKSVIHGSAGSDLDISIFKSNLTAHLYTRSGRNSVASLENLDPGVDDSSSEYSEYE